MQRLRAEFVNPFLQSVYNLYGTMLGSKAKRGAPKISDGKRRPKEIMTLVGLSGEVTGTVAISFPAESAIAVASRLLSTDLDEFDESASDAIGEIVNMVAGGAKAKISEIIGSTLELTLPTIIRGDEYVVYSPSKALWLEIPFTSDLGEFTLRVTFEASLAK
jgi:chemotaxis protein CheX